MRKGKARISAQENSHQTDNQIIGNVTKRIGEVLTALMKLGKVLGNAKKKKRSTRPQSKHYGGNQSCRSVIVV
jgi:hypothetical protein